MDFLSWFVPVSLAFFGLLFGSFANVVIWRVPRGESIVSPGSRCPACGHPVRWYDNVPIASWLVLGGRCRDCGAPISGRYPLVELLSGVLWASAALRFGPSWRTVACVVLFYLLLILAFIDIDTRRLPNVLVGVLAGLGLVGAAFSQLTEAGMVPLVGAARAGVFAMPLVASLAGAVLGMGLSGGIAGAYGALRGRSGLGAGDVKLLGAMGLFIGGYVLVALFAGSLVGAIAGIVGARRSGGELSTHSIPFGPFLAMGGVIAVMVGPWLWHGYLGLLGAA